MPKKDTHTAALPACLVISHLISHWTEWLHPSLHVSVSVWVNRSDSFIAAVTEWLHLGLHISVSVLCEERFGS